MKTNTSKKAAMVLALALVVMAMGFTGCASSPFNSTQRTVGPNGEVTTTTYTPSAASQAGESIGLAGNIFGLLRLIRD